MANLNRFVLGTAQLGMNYGINNKTGQPTSDSIKIILNKAAEAEVFSLDTADAYGNCAENLAQVGVSNFKVQSKFILDGKKFLDTLNLSLKRLKINQLWSYSFHRSSEFINFKDWDQVYEAKSIGKIKYLGVSAYSNDELIQLGSNPQVDLVQMPFNILDNWNKRGDTINFLKERNKIVHVRSLLLQGLFLKNKNDLPKSMSSLIPTLEKIKQISENANISISEICIRYALSKSKIDAVVLGLETVEQFNQNINFFKKGALDTNLINEIESNLIFEDSFLLNPSNWNLK